MQYDGDTSAPAGSFSDVRRDRASMSAEKVFAARMPLRVQDERVRFRKDGGALFDFPVDGQSGPFATPLTISDTAQGF
ncbi:hypothetical protein PQR25_11345 [Paraburkholderia nemoris]|uniref:hypothetical protein n=1 Tax=Paraburkholderia nemoris TaxID=2793076 RepID=UPI0038BDBD87